jgi:hypothetical protein
MPFLKFIVLQTLPTLRFSEGGNENRSSQNVAALKGREKSIPASTSDQFGCLHKQNKQRLLKCR